MTLKQSYYYLFYKLYNLSKNSDSIFPDDLAAAFAIDWLELIFLASIYFYLTPIIGRHGDLKIMSPPVLIPLIAIYIINHFAFIQNKKWQGYNHEFDRFSDRKNKIGSWIIIIIVTFVVVNFGISVYILMQVPIIP